MATAFSLQSPIIKRSGPNAVVYDLTDSATVAITLPVGSAWTSGLHWHEKHTEFLNVVKGSIEVVLGDQNLTVSASDKITEIQVDRGVWHEWKRADANKEEEVVVLERTEPHDGQKHVFFWNLNGVISQAQNASAPPYMPERLHGWLVEVWTTLSLFAIFNELDNVPVYVNFSQALNRTSSVKSETFIGQLLLHWMDWLFSHILLLAASWIAWVMGIKAIDKKFTPKDVMKRWKQSTRSNSGKKLP